MRHFRLENLEFNLPDDARNTAKKSNKFSGFRTCFYDEMNHCFKQSFQAVAICSRNRLAKMPLHRESESIVKRCRLGPRDVLRPLELQRSTNVTSL